MIKEAKRYLGRIRRKAFEAIGSDRYSRFPLYDLDRKLKARIDLSPGYFIEAGANDGLAQSNTYFLERFYGWRGLLIEPIPELAAACRKNRPNCTVVNAALVSDDRITSIEMKSINLMSKARELFQDSGAESDYVRIAEAAQPGCAASDVTVPARTLTSVLREYNVPRINFMSLDVEGYELSVIAGFDLTIFKPTNILVETHRPDDVLAALRGYELAEKLTIHDYLFRLR